VTGVWLVAWLDALLILLANPRLGPFGRNLGETKNAD
jgi:hypothetical protein